MARSVGYVFVDIEESTPPLIHISIIIMGMKSLYSEGNITCNTSQKNIENFMSLIWNIFKGSEKFSEKLRVLQYISIFGYFFILYHTLIDGMERTTLKYSMIVDAHR